MSICTDERLSDLPRGALARVVSFDLTTEDELRVKTLGICVGLSIELLQEGDPLVVRVAGANIGLSRRLASGINVIAKPMKSQFLPRE